MLEAPFVDLDGFRAALPSPHSGLMAVWVFGLIDLYLCRFTVAGQRRLFTDLPHEANSIVPSAYNSFSVCEDRSISDSPTFSGEAYVAVDAYVLAEMPVSADLQAGAGGE